MIWDTLVTCCNKSTDKMDRRDDIEKWNAKFAARPDETFPPEQFLIRSLGQLKSGTVLDIACGDGRNSLYLAENKFSVTGIDFSSVALERLKRFSKKRGLNITVLKMDLSHCDGLLGLSKFDNIVINHYKPDDYLWSIVPKLLKPAGIVIFCAFNVTQYELEGFPREYCLLPNERSKTEGFTLIRYESYIEGDRHLDGYVFRMAETRVT